MKFLGNHLLRSPLPFLLNNLLLHLFYNLFTSRLPLDVHILSERVPLHQSVCHRGKVCDILRREHWEAEGSCEMSYPEHWTNEVIQWTGSHERITRNVNVI